MRRSQAIASNPRWTEPWPGIHIGWPGSEVAASLIPDHGDTKGPELGTRIDEEEPSGALQREPDPRNTVTAESVPWRLSGVWMPAAAVPLKPGV